MDDVQNMEGEFEPTTLHMFIDCYHETFLPTFLHSQTAFQTIEDTITELAAVSTSLVSHRLTRVLQRQRLLLLFRTRCPSFHQTLQFLMQHNQTARLVQGLGKVKDQVHKTGRMRLHPVLRYNVLRSFEFSLSPFQKS